MLTAILLAGLCTALSLPVWIAFARRRGIHDLPSHRRLHAIATPRGGGVCIALALLVGLVFFPDEGRVPALGLSAVFAFALIGFWDDLRSPSAPVKLLLQCLAAVLLAFGLRDGWRTEVMVALPLLAVACLVQVNAWNFMDGINGLVATQSFLIAAVVALWPEQEAGTAFAAAWLVGACLGFLPFNLLRARSFLGDAGSYLLGAAVFLLLAVSVRAGKFSLPQAFVLCSGLLFDSGFTLIQRSLRGRNLWRAHREHWYQYVVRRGRSHASVNLMYAAWTLCAFALAAAMQQQPVVLQWMILFALSIVAWIVHVSLKRRALTSARQRKAVA